MQSRFSESENILGESEDHNILGEWISAWAMLSVGPRLAGVEIQTQEFRLVFYKLPFLVEWDDSDFWFPTTFLLPFGIRRIHFELMPHSLLGTWSRTPSS